MEVILLAGGLGTRLRSVVSDVPKPMAPVNDRPFLEYLMDKWISWGATHFILSVGYLHEKIITHFGNGYRSIPITYAIEKKPLGTGGALILAMTKLQTQNDCAVQNGDTFFDIDFPKFLQFHQDQGSYFTIALREVEENTRYSTVDLDEAGRVKGFLPPDNSKNALINGGIYILFSSLFKLYEAKQYSLEEDLLPIFIRDGVKVCAKLFCFRFFDIGIPSSYESLCATF